MDDASQPLLPLSETDDSSIERLPEPPLRVLSPGRFGGGSKPPIHKTSAFGSSYRTGSNSSWNRKPNDVPELAQVGNPKARGPMVLHHGGFWVQSIPWMIGVFCAACVAVGITLAVLSHHVFDSRTTSALVVRIVGIVIIVAGFLLPLVLITCCAWWKTPPRQSFYYDSLLDTMLAGDVHALFDVDGAENEAHGTIVVLGGATTSRNLSKVYSSSLAQTYRVIRLDLPGQGVMHAVSFSLARCERAVARVVDVVCGAGPVVILAHGAASYVAMHMAYRAQDRVAAVVCVGDIPNYLHATVFTGCFHRIYNLEWARYFTNNFYKSMISRSDLPLSVKQDALRDDFNLDGLPQVISELKGEALLHRFQSYAKPVKFLCPPATIARMQRALVTPNVSFVVFDGVHSKLPPLKVTIHAAVCQEIHGVMQAVLVTILWQSVLRALMAGLSVDHGGKSANYIINVILMSTGFFGIFLAYNTTQALETTLVSDKTLADVALAVLYAVFTCMAVPAPKLVNMLGPKLSMIVGAIPYILGCLANIDPTYGLTVPAFGLIGIGAALIWTGQAVYLSRCAMRESMKTGERQDRVSSRFNGMFYAAFQFNGFIGSVIAASAFTGSSSKDTARYLYIGLACAAGVGTFILWFIRSMPPIESTETGNLQKPLTEYTGLVDDENAATGKDLNPVGLLETLKLTIFSPRMTLTVPLILYNGMSLGFFFSDFPGFYAKKNAQLLLPTSDVGYVTAVFYLVASLASYMWGRVVPRIGRAGCMLIATCFHLAYYILMFFVTSPHIMHEIKYQSGGAYFIPFVLSAIFALGDSVWESQPPAVLQSASFFPDERDRDAAQGNLKVWQSLGFAIQFALGFGVTDIRIKLGILLALQVLSAACMYYLNARVVSLDADISKPAVQHETRASITSRGYGSLDDTIIEKNVP